MDAHLLSGPSDCLKGVSDKLKQNAKDEEIHKLINQGTFVMVCQKDMEKDDGYFLIDTRWVMVKKGTLHQLEVRARLCGKEFAH